MKYAIQTRDFNNDYRWSWEGSGSENIWAKVSLELQKLIGDGKPGVAVVYREGSYHVIITSIYKLGDKPNGKDFSSANIRLNLVFSEISQEKAKGIVRYYLDNQSDPGKAFADIVTWTNNRDKWTVNEEQLNAAFESIPEIKPSGNVLICEKVSELKSLLDFDWGQIEGPQYVFEPKSNNPVRIAVAPISEQQLPVPEAPKKTYGKLASFFFLLFLISAGLAIWFGIEWEQSYSTKQEAISKKNIAERKLKDKEENLKQAIKDKGDAIEAKNAAVTAQKDAEEQRDNALKDKENADQDRKDAINAKDEAETALRTKVAEETNKLLKQNGIEINNKDNSITIWGGKQTDIVDKKDEENNVIVGIKVIKNSNNIPSQDVNH